MLAKGSLTEVDPEEEEDYYFDELDEECDEDDDLGLAMGKDEDEEEDLGGGVGFGAGMGLLTRPAVRR
jgi:hypothetical protein